MLSSRKGRRPVGSSVEQREEDTSPDEEAHDEEQQQSRAEPAPADHDHPRQRSSLRRKLKHTRGPGTRSFPKRIKRTITLSFDSSSSLSSFCNLCTLGYCCISGSRVLDVVGCGWFPIVRDDCSFPMITTMSSSASADRDSLRSLSCGCFARYMFDYIQSYFFTDDNFIAVLQGRRESLFPVRFLCIFQIYIF